MPEQNVSETVQTAGTICALPQLGFIETALGGDDRARSQFAQTRAIAWPNLFEDNLLAKLVASADRADYRSQTIAGVGHREVEVPPLTSTAIILALQRRPLWDWLERVTGCGPIGKVDGQVAQTWPRPGDGLGWHDDMVGDRKRLFAITIGLGCAEYTGGDFYLRRKADKAPLVHFRHERPGQALIFEVSPDNEHQLEPLTSGGPRRIFAGWFMV